MNPRDMPSVSLAAFGGVEAAVLEALTLGFRQAGDEGGEVVFEPSHRTDGAGIGRRVGVHAAAEVAHGCAVPHGFETAAVDVAD